MQSLTPADLGIGRLYWTIREAVVAVDIDCGEVVLWNPAAETIFGYAAEEAVGLHIAALVPEQLRAWLQEGLDRYRATGRNSVIQSPTPVELPALRKTGEEITVEFTVTRIDDPSVGGSILLAIIRDVSERKRLEQERAARASAEATLRAVAERERYFRGLAEAVPVLIWLSGPDKACIYFNQRWLEFTGRTLDQELGYGWAEGVHPDDYARCIELYTTAFDARQEFEMEYRLRHADGTYRWLLDTGTPRYGADGTFEGYIGGCIDLTERKQAEQELLAQREAFRALHELAVATGSTLDPADLAAQVVERACRLLGTDDAALYGWDEEAGLLRPLSGNRPGRAAHNQSLRPGQGASGWALQSRQPVVVEDYERWDHAMPQGKAMGVRSVAAVPLVVQERVVGTLVVQHLSPRRFPREQVELLTLLAAQVGPALEASRLYREAQEAIRLRDDFLSVAAHELKTPMTVLRGASQLGLARLDHGESDPSRIRRTLRTIDEHTHRLARLVEQMLDASRIDTGHLQLERRTEDLVALVARVVEDLQSAADKHSIHLHAPPALPACVDGLRIEQVVTNLLDNAVRYSPGGGDIEVRLSSPGEGRVRLTVMDRGIGIPPEHRGWIFDRFHRAHDKDYRSGLGLGLYISRQIVELHGGTIVAEHPPEGGTRFVVELPANPD